MEQIFRARVSVTDLKDGNGVITIEGTTEREVDHAVDILCKTNEYHALFWSMRVLANQMTRGGVVKATWSKS